VRTRAAIHEAARTLFLAKGYAGTTMDDIAERAGLSKRTLYNNYADKSALFTEIVSDTIAFAEAFVGELHEEFTVVVGATNVITMLDDVGQRLALAIIRPEVIALRRLLVGEARDFPTLAAEYFDRAPGQVLEALADGFARLASAGLLRVADARCAAAQFAYLVAGEALDRAMLIGTTPLARDVIRSAKEGVETFLARYGRARGGRT
jgi:TetR/AcrR family transcriptional repressor of mexJK operon